MKNMRWSGLLFLLIAPFCGIFPALWYSMARWHGNFLEITLTAIGGIVILLPALLVPLLAFAGIERMSKRIRVDTLGGHIEVRKTSWLWSKTTRFNTTDVAIVNAISSGREMVGHRSYSYYNILATLVNGKIIELVWAVRDTDIAAALAVVLNHACGSPRSTTGAGVRIAQWRRPAVPLLAMLLLAAALPSAVEMSLQTPMWDGYDNDTDRLEHLAAQAADPGYFQQWLRTDDTLHLPPLWLLTRWITETRNRLAAQRKAQPDVSVISLPSNPQPVVIDGRIDEREWQGSVLLALQPETAGSVLRLRSDGQRLIVAADVPADTTAEGFDQLRVSLHMGLVPALVSERIHVDRSGGISVLRFLRAEVVGEQASSKTRTYSKTHTQRLRYEKTLAATRVDGHRRYELSIDMQEAGLAADVPFTLWAEIEGDPQHHADGKFKARTNLGLIGEHGQPLWLKIAP